jgi:predicted RNase H-like nuclease (RuvC/YqgF family)
MPPKKKSVVPKRTIADVEAEYHPQLDAMHTHLEHMRWESNRLESLGEALDMDLNIARERSVRDAGRLEAMREVHVEKKLSDEALQFTINAECQELSGTAFIKERRVGMLKEERDQLRQQLDALKAKSDADSWEQGDINAAQSEIARLVSEVAEAQRRSQRYVRVLDLAKGLEDPCHYGPSSSYFPPTTTTTNTTHLHRHLLKTPPKDQKWYLGKRLMHPGGGGVGIRAR